MRTYEVFKSYSCWLRPFVLTSDINDICPFPTFSTLVSVILVSRSFLVFLVFRPFPERLVCLDQDGHTGWQWQWFTVRSMRYYELRRHILRKGCASRNAIIRKEKFWAQISSEVKTLKALKETVECIYRPSLKYGNEQSFSSTDTWTKENKAVNLLRKETL